MLRWLGVLVVLAYAALLGVALRQPRRPPPAPPAAQPLTVYYEKDPLPVELCEDWAAKNRVDI
ncbi:MAG: hypothetical protein LBD30_05445, partial [Verrucomicrobiales bacterium]|nr:hypothetical protein [Verrucomicrobiales bacterium]